jgi:hypothetical protein
MSNARRPRKRRVLGAGVLAALLIALLYHLTCEGGFGPGGGTGSKSEHQPAPPDASTAAAAVRDAAPPPRCQLRLDPSGLTLDGAAITVEAAVAACRSAGAADLIVTGDSAYGASSALRAALDDAGVAVFDGSRGAAAVRDGGIAPTSPGSDGGIAPTSSGSDGAPPAP